MHIRTIVTRTSSAMVVLAFAALLLVAIGPHTGTYRAVSILSGSMEPTFAAGDAIISIPMPTSAIRPGDVITYHAPVPGEPVVTHRVTDVEREKGGIVVETRGDANDNADPWRARLQGDTAWRQVAVIPHAGAVIGALRSDHLRDAMLYGAPALLVVLLLVAIWMPHRRRDELEWAERIDLNSILDAIQDSIEFDQALVFDAACEVCGSSIVANEPCPFCGAVVLAPDEQVLSG